MPALKNKRHEQFALMVAQGYEPHTAYTAVGYEAKSDKVARVAASRVMRYPLVAERLQELRAVTSAKAVADAALDKTWVLENLKEITERCMQKAPVLNLKGEQVTDEDGRHVWKFDARGAIGAVQLIGKELGMFVDKSEVTVKSVDEMSRDEIEAELAQLRTAQDAAGKSGSVH